MRADRVVTLVASALGRDDWGRAMRAELAAVPRGMQRRRFALGCVGALLVGLPALAWAGLAAAAAALGIVAAALVRFPGLVTGLGTWLAIGFFVVVVVAYVVGAAGLSVRLERSMLLRGAVLAGASIAGAWWAVGLVASEGAPPLMSTAMLVLGPGVAGVAGAWGTVRVSWAVGVQCVGLASLLAGFLLFFLWGGQTVAFAGRPYDPGLVRDFHTSGAPDLATYAVSDSLGSAMMLLLLVPLVSLVAAAAGAMVATCARRRRPSA